MNKKSSLDATIGLFQVISSKLMILGIALIAFISLRPSWAAMGKFFKILSDHSNIINDIHFTPPTGQNPAYIFTASADFTARQYSISPFPPVASSSLSFIRQYNPIGGANVKYIRSIPGTDFVFFAGNRARVEQYWMSNGSLVRVYTNSQFIQGFDLINPPSSTITGDGSSSNNNSVPESVDHGLLMSCTTDGSVHLYSLRNGTQLRSASLPGNPSLYTQILACWTMMDSNTTTSSAWGGRVLTFDSNFTASIVNLYTGQVERSNSIWKTALGSASKLTPGGSGNVVRSHLFFTSPQGTGLFHLCTATNTYQYDAWANFTLVRVFDGGFDVFVYPMAGSSSYNLYTGIRGPATSNFISAYTVSPSGTPTNFTFPIDQGGLMRVFRASQYLLGVARDDYNVLFYWLSDRSSPSTVAPVPVLSLPTPNRSGETLSESSSYTSCEDGGNRGGSTENSDIVQRILIPFVITCAIFVILISGVCFTIWYSRRQRATADGTAITNPEKSQLTSSTAIPSSIRASHLGSDITVQTDNNRTSLITTIISAHELSIPSFLLKQYGRDYFVGEKVGQGGSGSIYECIAMDPEIVARCNTAGASSFSAPSSNNTGGKKFRRKMICKVISMGRLEDLAERLQIAFLNELSIMWRFRDRPGFCKVYAYSDSPVALVLRFYETGDLSVLIFKKSFDMGKAYTCGFVTNLFRLICIILREMHESGFAHCDIKPANILLDYDAQNRTLSPIISDFGLTRVISKDSLKVSAFMTNDLRGASWSYAGPEVMMRFRNRSQELDSEVWKAGDVYAMGMTLYEMVTRARAW